MLAPSECVVFLEQWRHDLEKYRDETIERPLYEPGLATEADTHMLCLTFTDMQNHPDPTRQVPCPMSRLSGGAF